MDQVKSNLSKLVDKTPINDKLLSRPRFRYLYDRITEINQKSNCFQLPAIDADNVSKEDKVEFLRAVIEQVGSEVIAKPSKIVAGIEVENTWQLLNLIVFKVEKNRSDLEKDQKQLKNSLSKEKVLKKSNSKEKKDVKTEKTPQSAIKAEKNVADMKKISSKEKTKEKPEVKPPASPYTAPLSPKKPKDNSTVNSNTELPKKTSVSPKSKDLVEKDPKSANPVKSLKVKSSTHATSPSIKQTANNEQPKSPQKKKNDKNGSDENISKVPIIHRKKSDEFANVNIVQAIPTESERRQSGQPSFIDSFK